MSLVFMDLVCWLGFLHKVSTSFCRLVSGLCMLHHNFYCKFFSCYIPVTKRGLRDGVSSAEVQRGGEAESQFKSVRLIEVVVCSKLHRIWGVIARRNTIVSLRVPTTYSAPSRHIKTFGTRGSKVKTEYRIQDGGRPGTGIPNILDE
jgi:hypothetical protein